VNCICTHTFTRDCHVFRTENGRCPIHARDDARRHLAQTFADIEKIKASVVERLTREQS
jgi:hypothetical protein